MPEVVVVGSFTAEPGKESEALDAFKALVEPTHGESGCIPHISAVLQRVRELFGESGDIVVYEAVPGGETAKGALAAHAGSAS